MEFFTDPETWVGIGTLVFFAILIWQKVPSAVAKGLDARAAVIAKELEEARTLREEAQALLAQYQKKAAAAESEAGAIVTEARAEAERYAKESRIALDAQIERRAKQAQDKIAQAEAQAMAELRAMTTDAAIAAAERLIAERMNETRASGLITSAIKDIPGKLN